MSDSTANKLSSGHKKAIGIEERVKTAPQTVEEYYARNEHLKQFPTSVIRRAWFTLAHLLLEPHSHLVDMGCGDGLQSYAMATLNPQIKVTAIDQNKENIKEAKKKYKRPNLEYICADITNGAGFKENSVDAVVNSFVLHQVYSHSKYNDRPVVTTLENQLKILKPGGLIFIRDYAMPPPGEYVLLEMPDVESIGKSLKDLSEADLLVWYSENARPREAKGCDGFFLEELPPRFPQTRLFRLPYKWAYEFIMRKDHREKWEDELPKEYTFFTQREYRKNLRALGTRVLYTAPHWDENKIKEDYEGHFHLYDDNGTPLGAPATSFIAVAQKMEEGTSLRLHERRPSSKPNHRIRITAMRNDADGRILEVVSRDLDLTEVIPYRISEDGTLNVFIHEGLPRGIVNAVPRTGKEIDGKRWSGHMTEAIAVDTNAIHDVEEGEYKELVKFTRDYLGLKPSPRSTLEEGPSYFPAPDFIDERILTRYVRVEKSSGPIEPKIVPEDLQGFTTTGAIREVSAQSILNAIAVGFIPNARLELQIEALFHKLGIKAENWNETPLVLEEFDFDSPIEPQELMGLLSGDDKRYRSIRGTTGQIRSVQSIFVDEGRVEGGITGLTSKDMEFVISDETTLNTAVVLPLGRDMNTNEIMAGVELEYLPVPQRYKGNGFTVRAPSFTLPKEITNIEQARQFIADKYGVPTENVARLGESYFCHIGVTPQRVFPFAVAPQGHVGSGLGGGVTRFAPIRYIFALMFYDSDDLLIFALNRVYKALGEDSDIVPTLDFAKEQKGSTHSVKSHQYSDVTGAYQQQKPAEPQNNNENNTPIPAPIKPLPFEPKKAQEVIKKAKIQKPAELAKWEARPKPANESETNSDLDEEKSIKEERRLDPK